MVASVDANLRPRVRLNTDSVIMYVRTIRSKKFTTDQVAERFKVGRQQAAAAIAIMSIKGVVAKADPPKKDGSSHWVFTG